MGADFVSTEVFLQSKLATSVWLPLATLPPESMVNAVFETIDDPPVLVDTHLDRRSLHVVGVRGETYRIRLNGKTEGA